MMSSERKSSKKEKRKAKNMKRNLRNSNKLNDSFACFEKYNKGIGRKLLEKHGWREGMGLGKSSSGRVVPVTVNECAARKPREKRGVGYEREEISNCDLQNEPKVEDLFPDCRMKSWVYLISLPAQCYPDQMHLTKGKIVEFRRFETKTGHSSNITTDDFYRPKSLAIVPANITANAKNWKEFIECKIKWRRVVQHNNMFNHYKVIPFSQYPIVTCNPNHPSPHPQSQFLNYSHPSTQPRYPPFHQSSSSYNHSPKFSWNSPSQFVGYPAPPFYPQVRSHVRTDEFGQNAPPNTSAFIQQSEERRKIVNGDIVDVVDMDEIMRPQSDGDNNVDATLIDNGANIVDIVDVDEIMRPQIDGDNNVDEVSFESSNVPLDASVMPNKLKCEKEAADIQEKLKDPDTVICGIELVLVWMGKRRKQTYMKVISYQLYQSAHKPTSFFNDDQSRFQYVEFVSQIYDLIESRKLKMFTMDQWRNVLLLMLNTSIEFRFERNLDALESFITQKEEKFELKEIRKEIQYEKRKRKKEEYMNRKKFGPNRN